MSPIIINTRGMVLTLDSSKLRELSRAQLQSLAKREVVRAAGKTDDIIRRLMNKYPKGVPAPEEDEDPSASSVPLKRYFFKKASKETPAHSPVPDPPQDHTDLKGKGKAIANAAPASSPTEALELLDPEDEPVAVPSDSPTSNPHVPVCEAPPDRTPAQPPSLSGKPSHEANNGEDAHSAATPKAQNQADDENFDKAYDYVKGAPSHYMMLDALRQLTTLTNAIPVMQTRVAESRCLIRRTESLLENATPDARELCVTREYLETVLLARMKLKRELWDGTGRMEKGARKARMEWLRAQRRKAAEQKWAEVNEFNRTQGRKPEPLSAFLGPLESDEEEIESLQTTPTSSRGGSGRRAREESVDAGSEADSSSQKKRARS